MYIHTMTTTGHEAATHNALRGIGGCMARRSFYVVSFVSRDGSGAEEVSRFFNTKRAAMKWAAWLCERCAVRSTVWLGCAGGIRVADFAR